MTLLYRPAPGQVQGQVHASGITSVDGKWSQATVVSNPQQYIVGLLQDRSNSSALAMELLQSCTKPSI